MVLWVKGKLVLRVLALCLAIGGAGWAEYRGLAEPGQPAPAAKIQPPLAKDQATIPAKKVPPIATDVYGDPLPEGAVARIGTIRYRHPSHINLLAFAPGGDFIVSQAGDGVRVWETKTGKQLRYFPDLVGNPISTSSTGCDLSPDGKALAVLDWKTETVELWDIVTGRPLRKLAKSYGEVRFSPNGRFVITGGDNSSVKLWDPESGEMLRSWQPHGPYLFSAAFSGDSKTLITQVHGQIRFWDIATGRQTREISTGSKSIDKFALSPDGRFLATLGSTNHTPHNFISIWDVASGKEVRQLAAIVKQDAISVGLTAFLFAPDGKSIVTGGMDTLQIWDPATGKELRRIPLDCYISWCLAYSRDGKMLATAAAGLTIRLFDAASGQDLAPPGELQLVVSGLEFSANGRSLVTACDKTLHLWDPITGQRRFRLGSHQDFVNDICLAADGRTLFSVGPNRRVSVWDMEIRKEVHSFQVNAPLRWLRIVAAPDGKTLAITNEKAVMLLDATTGNQLKEYGGHEPSISAAAFIAGGQKLVVCSEDHKLHLWDLASGRKVLQFPFPRHRGRGPFREGASYWVAISHDSRLIAYGSLDKYVALMDIATGREIACFTNLPDAPCVMAFAPDGRTLAWFGWSDPPVRVMETASGKERRQLLGHKGRLRSLSFSTDGKMLASGSMDTTALVWDLAGPHDTDRRALSPQELSACWDDLASDDATRAIQAIRKLAHDPARAIPFLGKRLQPVPSVDGKVVAQLIRDLGSDAFADREKARRELEGLGELSASACHKALKEPATLEVLRRLEALVEKQAHQSSNPSADFLRTLRALETLELAGTPEAHDALAKMSEGATESRLTVDAKASLERLARPPSFHGDKRSK